MNIPIHLYNVKQEKWDEIKNDLKSFDGVIKIFKIDNNGKFTGK